MRRYKKALIFISFLVLLVCPSFICAQTDSHQVSCQEIIQKRKDLGRLQREIKNCQRKKGQAQKKEKAASQQLKKVNRQIKARKRELAIYDWNLEKNKKQRETVFRSFEKLSKEKKKLTDVLIKELCFKFKESLVPQVLMAPGELGRLIIESNLEKMVDTSVISFSKELTKELNFLELQKEKLEKYRELEMNYKKAAQKGKKKAKKISHEKRKLLTRYQKERKKQDEAVGKLKEQIVSLKKLVKRLEKREGLNKDLRFGRFRKGKGKLLMPVDGVLLKARYGQSYDIYKGITIKAPRGEEVTCVAAGKVIYADRFRGFGNIVIIEHGGGYSTLYAHLDNILVKTGEKTVERQLIGIVGDSGSLTREPGLYFEIRQYGESLEPLEWLSR